MNRLFYRLKDIFDALPYPVFAKDNKHRWIYGNQAFSDLLGRDDFIGLDDSAIFSPEQVEVFWAEDERVLMGLESLNEEQIGEDMFALTKKVPLTFPDGSAGLVGIIIDAIKMPEGATGEDFEPSLLDYANSRADMLQKRLNEAVAEKEKAVYLAQTDLATGLLNRVGFDAHLQKQIGYAEETGERFGMALIDIDHFKRVNDQFGHAAGDIVVNVIAKRLAKVPGVVGLARMAGDEFALISSPVNVDTETLRTRIDKVCKYVFRPVSVGDNQIALSGSAGVCFYPDHGDSAASLMNCADHALLAAKHGGRNQARIFDEGIQQQWRRRRQIEDKLPIALEERQIVPHYQPILSSTERAPLGVEVLARWNDAELGHIGPDEFIPIASELGLLSRLDRIVLDQAIKDSRPWIERGDIDFISVNVSPIDIVSRGYATDLLKRMRASAFEPSNLHLEILESAIVEDVDSARRNLERLREAGIQIALDDYGTGFSNLRALLDMPLDKLKIDKSLVAGIDYDDKVLDLVISIVQFGRSLELDLVAEGVETAAQSAFIEGAGCPQMQGYFFARAMPAHDAGVWLTAQRTTSPELQQSRFADDAA